MVNRLGARIRNELLQSIDGYQHPTSAVDLESFCDVNSSPVPDVMLEQLIWPKLNSHASPSLLWHFRRINRLWKSFVARTIEWQALEIVRVDHHSYLITVAETDVERRSLTTRLGFGRL